MHDLVIISYYIVCMILLFWVTMWVVVYVIACSVYLNELSAIPIQA